jgi:hypothetical protein
MNIMFKLNKLGCFKWLHVWSQHGGWRVFISEGLWTYHQGWSKGLGAINCSNPITWIMLDLIEVSTRHDVEKMHGYYSNALGRINEIKFHTNLATCHHVRFEN